MKKRWEKGKQRKRGKKRERGKNRGIKGKIYKITREKREHSE